LLNGPWRKAAEMSTAHS